MVNKRNGNDVKKEKKEAIRRDREYRLRETLALETRAEKGRRLWIVVRDMDVWNYNARRKYFSRVCNATKDLCYKDEFNSPHVNSGDLEACKRVIRQTMSQAVLDDVPENQRRLTDMW